MNERTDIMPPWGTTKDENAGVAVQTPEVSETRESEPQFCATFKSAERRPWYARPRTWVLFILVALFLAFFGPRLIRLPGLVSRARAEWTFWQSLRGQGAQAMLRPETLDETAAHLRDTRSLIAAARRDWGFLLSAAPAFGWVPGVGGDLAALPGLAATGEALLDGAVPLFEAARPGLEAISEGASKAIAPLMDGLAEHPEAVAQADVAFDKAARAWQGVNTARLSRLDSIASLLDRSLPLLEVAPEALRLLPALLGADGPRRYLILAQNSDEIRATGGFISGAGILEIERGEIKSLDIGDSYTIADFTMPHPIPPIALETHMLAQILLLRDANWWADFPTSARAAWKLFEQDTGQQVDGVIAMDTPALQLLVEAAEPVRLKEYDDIITGDNLMERIQEYWASPEGGPAISSDDPKWWRLRKEFMGVLAKAVVERILSDTTELDLGKLAGSAFRLLDERHLLLYLPDAEALLRERKWDGAMVPAQGDYLFVVDSNVGFNKVNPVVDEAITYTVDLSQEPPRAHLQIRYTHRSSARLDECVHESRYGDAYADMMDRCYWDYIRVFVPQGAQLVSRAGLEDGGLAEPEQGRAAFDGLMVLKPGDAHEVAFHYRLPSTVVADGVYRLYVQKQSGTWAVPLRIVVRDAIGTLATFETDLATDREFAAALRK